MQTPTHSEMVRALAKNPVTIIDELTPQKMNFLHMAIGLVGEAIEFANHDSPENALEELSDIAFYAEGVRIEFGIKETIYLDEVYKLDMEQLRSYALELIGASGEILDAAKKAAIYDQEVNLERVALYMESLDHSLHHLRGLLAFTRQQVLDYNIAKLSKRYPNFNYTNQAAQDRADKA